ncbi:MAG: trehalase family glycosidase [Candidatus Pseudobacter hemicellulosilyticus]|uniref:Trehalase family glycosidase n=1 Tax=Candidatus Pseudobacter hemicellulosilyticus TaxID=3121375 RepID=A0AAJ5WWF3_9BACT|nr:MAG: trehalase family glycosidase [Pseudobacter sp.]
MKKNAAFIFFLVCLFSFDSFAQLKLAGFDTTRLNGTHDLQLPAWGPYSKKYAGISHVPDPASGMRFDFSVLPGYYRNKLLVPNVRFESLYFPWKVANDLSSITYRYELEWKDQVYTDVTYTLVDSVSVLVSMHSVNNTALPQNLSLNLIASVEYPDNYGERTIKLAPGAQWINAVNYRSLSFAAKKPNSDLVYDGWMRGEVRNARLMDGRGVGEGFGRQAGDIIEYVVNWPAGNRKGMLQFVYSMKNGRESAVQLSGLVNQKIIFKPSDTLAVLNVPFEAAGNNTGHLVLTSLGGGEILLNGLVLSTEQSGESFSMVPAPMRKTPVTQENNTARTLLLKYQDMPLYYGLTWDKEPFKIRSIRNDELDIFFRNETHNHVAKVLNGNGKGDYANVFIRPVELAPFSSQTATALLRCGTQDAVLAGLKIDASQKKLVLNNNSPSEEKGILEEGRKYLFSQQLLKSTLLSNVVYPVYTQDQYIKHFTPGKWWNSLYTWDAGFIALGLSSVNPTLAAEYINTYMTPPGGQSAFVHHGSPLPVQAYAFLDLWNKTQSKELLAYFYPRLKQYYEFLAGRNGSSSTNVLPSDLLKTWDYFYNSGGWDDYPPQEGVHHQRLEARVTPTITTAHVIRVAKILSMAARALGQDTDLEAYNRDISRFSTALQQYSWDAASGYFSYVLHDNTGKPTGFFKDPVSGANFNMGLDGAYPLMAGICSADQQELLLDKIFSPKHMWSPSGITVVDQSAPYYRTDGYWNGAVWMPHQWFVWKSMLDLNKPELAFKVAEKGLDVYKRETDASYFTFEHFLAASGRGAGWHQFSGLSTPVLSWFDAYYKTGTITPGFEIWINKQSFNKDHSSYTAELSFDQATQAHQRTLLAGMNPAFGYKATFDAQAVAIKVLQKGVLQVALPATNSNGILKIERK